MHYCQLLIDCNVATFQTTPEFDVLDGHNHDELSDHQMLL